MIDPAAEGNVTEKKRGGMGTRVFIVIGVLALLGLLLWGLLKAGETRPEAGDVAPAFTVGLFDGYGWEGSEVASLGDMNGKVVVLNFWASWCVECRVEAALLEQTWRRYRDQGVVFLGVAYVDAEHKSLAYLEEFGITYPNGADLGSSISNAYKITGVPETFFIGRDGKVSRYVLGPVNETVLTSEIETLLAQ
jgi:cytochrome c biogenesis protein CcmG/thiol:disulfide interchange protein DsbE